MSTARSAASSCSATVRSWRARASRLSSARSTFPAIGGDSALRAGPGGHPAELALRRTWPEGRLAQGRGSIIHRGREYPDQTPQPDGRQVAPPDHRADGLLVELEPPGSIGNGEQQRRKADRRGPHRLSIWARWVPRGSAAVRGPTRLTS